MKHEIPCEMIEDLLPSYVERLTAERTEEEIRAHLSRCENCRKKYEAMGCDLSDGSENRKDIFTELDYLKKVRKKNRIKVAGTIICCILAAAILIGIKIFWIGFPDSYYTADSEKYENQIVMDIALQDEEKAISNVKYKKENGVTRVFVYSVPKTRIRHSGRTTFSIDISEMGEYLFANGDMIYPDGSEITKLASDLYNAKNPYIGDMSANGKLANLLFGRHMEQFGRCTFELQTTEEPYDWCFHFQEAMEAEKTAMLEQSMREYAIVLLALVDNAGSIRWTYEETSENATTEIESVMTIEQASEILGDNVKSFGENLHQVQKLLDVLGIR